MDFTLRYSQLVEKLPTRAFFSPLEEDEEVEVGFKIHLICALLSYLIVSEQSLVSELHRAFNPGARSHILTIKTPHRTTGRPTAHN
jgi:hypothetical protein